MSGYRPRGAISRAIFAKLHNDNMLEKIDLGSLYRMQELPEYQKMFLRFEPDENTIAWLERSKGISGNLWLQIWFIVAKCCLSFFMSQTDLNGVLSRGSMFILSENQLVAMLLRGGFKASANGPKVLDIGAGDGQCTLRVQSALRQIEGSANLPHIHVTETSWIMRKRLDKLDNFTVLEVSDVRQLRDLDLVTCLNVLDRCADPHQMLEDIHNILSPSGRAMFALVLPYSHYVETNTSHLPVRPLMPHWPNTFTGGSMSSCDCSEHQCDYTKRRPSFEEETRIFFELLQEKGFQINAWTKAPYLCEGDIRQSFYWLIDIVVVVSKAPVAASSSATATATDATKQAAAAAALNRKRGK